MIELEKLDLLLKHYCIMLVDHDPDNKKLDKVSQELIADNHNHSAFRTYKRRLISDGLIEQDTDGDGRWMASHRGITFSYVVAAQEENRRIADAELRNERMERNEERLVTWTKRLFWGTVAVALGAIGLVAWEMWHYYHPLLHQSCS